MATDSGTLRYLDTFQDEQIKLRHDNALNALLQTSGSTLVHSLSYYLQALMQTDEVLIDKVPAQKVAIKRRLLLTYSLILNNNRYGNYDDELFRCENLIDYIDRSETVNPIESYAQLRAHPDKPVSYCGIQAGQWMGERILEVISVKSKAVIDWMSAINEKRLYWVWGGGVLRTVLSLLPAEFYNVANAKTVASAPSRFTGYMSWILYFARFGLNTFLLLKGTFSVTSEERAAGTIDYWERFKTQWNLRKFTLLNDSIWGIANMVCFFWFKGSDGDALTIGLLAFDLFISVWNFEEQKTEFNQQMLKYNQEIEKLEQSEYSPSNQQKIDKLIKERSKCQRAWDNKKIELMSDIAYALGLTIAFAIFSMPFLPIAAATFVIVGVIGAVLCFALTVINNALKSGLKIKTSHLSAKEAKREFTDKIDDFKALMAADSNINNANKIFLFLEIKQSLAESAYHKQMIQYQTIQMVRDIMIQTLIPAVLFATFVFLPFGIGVGVIAAALALVVVTNLIIEKTFKPEEVHFPEFDNQEYEEFCRNPDMWNRPAKTAGFFGDSKGRTPDDEIPLLDPNAPA